MGQKVGQNDFRASKKAYRVGFLSHTFYAPCMKQRDDIKNQKGYFVGKMSKKRFVFCGEEYSSILKWGKCGAET